MRAAGNSFLHIVVPAKSYLMHAGRCNKMGVSGPLHQGQGLWLLMPNRLQLFAQQQRVWEISVQIHVASASQHDVIAVGGTFHDSNPKAAETNGCGTYTDTKQKACSDGADTTGVRTGRSRNMHMPHDAMHERA